MAKVYQATHVGKVRNNNEDSLIVIEPETFVVADGMGGVSAGEVASQMLVDTVKLFLSKNPAPWDENVLAQAILLANDKILNAARRHEEYRGMGTTATILSLDGGTAYFAHVGDSRLYRLRGDSFQQMTVDHSYVETLIRRGELTAEEARVHPMKNVLIQAVGAIPELHIDKDSFKTERGDTFLLCTDGLTNMVKDATIAEILKAAQNPADALIDAALNTGGKDNISVIVAGVD